MSKTQVKGSRSEEEKGNCGFRVTAITQAPRTTT